MLLLQVLALVHRKPNTS